MFKHLFGREPSQETKSPPVAQQNTWLKSLVQSLPFSNVAIETLSQADLEDAYEQLEDNLIRTDMGVDLAVELVDGLRKSNVAKTQEGLQGYLQQELDSILAPVSTRSELSIKSNVLNILLFVGVNGVGKTTMIGKLANYYRHDGKSVLIAAGDTFRAAAVEQLGIWAERAGVPLVSLEKGNSAAVVFEALQRAKSERTDVLFIDTAGRLQNKFNLMEELKNIRDVIEKEAPEGYSIEKLIVVDATTGQNAIQQMKVFTETIELTGIALTKFDGSAKGGILFALAKQFGIPIKLLGTGESITDFEFFKSETVLNKLF